MVKLSLGVFHEHERIKNIYCSIGVSCTLENSALFVHSCNFKNFQVYFTLWRWIFIALHPSFMALSKTYKNKKYDLIFYLGRFPSDKRTLKRGKLATSTRLRYNMCKGCFKFYYLRAGEHHFWFRSSEWYYSVESASTTSSQYLSGSAKVNPLAKEPIATEKYPNFRWLHN